MWFGPREQNLRVLIKGARVPCEPDTRQATLRLGALRFGFGPLSSQPPRRRPRATLAPGGAELYGSRRSRSLPRRARANEQLGTCNWHVALC